MSYASSPRCLPCCSVISVTANVPSLVNFFGSYYLATLVMLKPSAEAREMHFGQIFIKRLAASSELGHT